jgi:hypothetical protein
MLAADPLFGKMAKQIDKYGEKLFADPIVVKTPNGTIIIYLQRTNNILEQFFRSIRRGERRKTGNDSMCRTLQTMLADTPLVKIWIIRSTWKSFSRAKPILKNYLRKSDFHL